MSKAIKEIKRRISKINSLSGFDYCLCVSELEDNATEQEWIDAWNKDQSIISGMINDIELLCVPMEKEDFNH